MGKNYFKDDIVISYVAFSEKKGGKIRPTAIIVDVGEWFVAYPITSQFGRKSSRIQRQYYKIKEWQNAGLTKPSWIDVGNKIEINKKLISTKKIGSLSILDIRGLREFIEHCEENLLK